MRSARPGETTDDFINTNVAWGPSPRASQSLMLGVKARALLDGRLSPSVDDVLALATPVMRHRMAVTFTSRAEGITLDDVIERVTKPLR